MFSHIESFEEKERRFVNWLAPSPAGVTFLSSSIETIRKDLVLFVHSFWKRLTKRVYSKATKEKSPEYLASYGQMPAQNADHMGDIVLSTSMGYLWNHILSAASLN